MLKALQIPSNPKFVDFCFVCKIPLTKLVLVACGHNKSLLDITTKTDRNKSLQQEYLITKQMNWFL